jgi:LysM repeat protein
LDVVRLARDAGEALVILTSVDRVCPLLGLHGDARSAIDGVDGTHRCFAEPTPIPLDRQQQARVCLSDTYERCDRYLAHVSRHGGVHPGRSSLAGGLVTTRLVLAPEPAWRGMAGRARQARSGPLAAIGAAVAVLGIGGVALATGVLDPGSRAPSDLPATSPNVSPTATPTARATPTPTLTASPSPTPVPTPVPEPTLAPTAAPTPGPTVAAPPPQQRTYAVQQGDTLSLIAGRFGTTVQAIQAANGIADPNEIFVGQVLVIP